MRIFIGIILNERSLFELTAIGAAFPQGRRLSEAMRDSAIRRQGREADGVAKRETDRLIISNIYLWVVADGTYINDGWRDRIFGFC